MRWKAASDHEGDECAVVRGVRSGTRISRRPQAGKTAKAEGQMNLRETRERIGIRPWRLVVLLLCLAIPLLVVPPLARYSGILDALALTCDAEEKAALLEFPQYAGKVVGKDIKGPLGG